MFLKKYVGDKAFYKMVLTIAVPMMVQNGISNFVNLLDNLMIGRIGTNALSGVAITNQIIFVFYLLMFGATAGVGIFTAQYHGMGDVEGVRYTFRVKLIINTLLSAGGIALLYFNSDFLIGLFLKGEGSAWDALQTLEIGHDYMRIMLIGLVPIAITNSYSGTLRDTGQTRIPMLASLSAIFVNLIGNFILIYGYFGMPALGAVGAATATVISRFVELTFLLLYTARHSSEHPFIIGAYTKFYVPWELFWRFFVKSIPLIVNETLWSLGQTTLNQSFSFRSLIAMAAINIESTVWMLFSVAFAAMGEAAGIITGQILGNGEIDRAIDDSRKLRAFTVACGIVFGLLMLLISPFFPKFYNTTDEVRSMASRLILISGLLMPLIAYTHVTYFILRSGGNTFITFTRLPVVTMVAIVKSLELIKCLTGGKMIQSGIWAKKIVDDTGAHSRQ